RATIAKEKGLEPLAEVVFQEQNVDVESLAKEYFDDEHELFAMEDVVAGVNDIIAEWISDDPKFREHIRLETFKRGQLTNELKDGEGDSKKVYEMYYEYTEAIRSIVSHRILAVNRGEKEDVLRLAIVPPTELIVKYLQREVILAKVN